MKNDTREMILNARADADACRRCLESFNDNSAAQDTILILAGLLKYEVLRVVLSKRWRVNYGVFDKGHRKMAIPFKAKDVAAEMTEFGQPDVAIAFTHLSYYYSGLSDAQLYECFRCVGNLPNAEENFNIWMNAIETEWTHRFVRTAALICWIRCSVRNCSPHCVSTCTPLTSGCRIACFHAKPNCSRAK